MASLDIYVPYIKEFKGSKEFSYLAEYFNKNKCYTNLTPGTLQYKKFWDDVHDKCINGFTNSFNQKITGQHFYYLNFCRIELQDENSKKKIKGFPKFIDLDYDYFWLVDYCRINEKSLICIKGRRQGYSFKGGGICSHEFTFVRDSKCIIGAFLGTFSQQTMYMALDNLNWLNAHTEFRKQRNPDLKDYVMSRYQADIGDGVKVWKGYQSSISSISFKDRPEAGVGKSCTWLLLDEIGIFPNILDTWGFTEPLIRDGSTYTGTALLYGSSGNMDFGTKYTYEMFINPDKYNMLSFTDSENPENKVGYFSSASKGRWGICKDPTSKWFKQLMVDENGNSNEEAAIDDILYEREIARKGADPKSVHSKITQFPLTWKEAFLRSKGAIFASIELAEHLANVESKADLRDSKKKVELYFDENHKIKARLNPDLNEITDFPLRSDESKEGCIVIYEDPEQIDGNIPPHLYLAGNDPYDMDKADSSTSLGSFIVYKRFYQANKTHDCIVAEYTGRPEFADTFYENCRKLCIYYNCKVLYENQLKGFKAYFEQKNCLHYLYETPQILKDIVKDSKVQRGYGIHMNRGNGITSTGIKDQCELYLKQWLYEEQTDITGKKILNLHTIKNIALLKELMAYDREINTDRCLSRGTKIFTNNGWKKVEYIEPGDIVLTHKGNYKPVTYISEHKPETNNLLNFKVQSTYENLEVTPNHPIYIKSINRNGVTKKRILKQFEKEATFIEASKVKKGDLILIPKRRGLKKVKYEDDLLYLMGWYLSDGTISGQKNKISICLQGDQEHIADRLIEIIEKYTDGENTYVKSHISKRKNKLKKIKGYKVDKKFKAKKIINPGGKYCILVNKQSRVLYNLFRDHCGLPNQKEISSYLFNSNNLLPLVLGFFEGDGHQKKRTNYDGCNRNVIECCGIYENLIKQIRQILIDNNIWNSICIKNRNTDTRKNQYNLTLSGRYANMLAENSLKFKVLELQTKKEQGALLNEEGFWTPIKEIINTNYNDNVFNFEVKDDNSYIANGITTHNCIAFFLCILQVKELHKLHMDSIINNNKNNDDFFERLWQNRNTISKRSIFSNQLRK